MKRYQNDCNGEIIKESENAMSEKYMNKTVIELFEEQVERTPDMIAVEMNDEFTHRMISLTYKELNERANYIGENLRKIGITNNSIVAVISERNVEMLVAIYGILKSGAAYLPIDPNHPYERIEYMIRDSDADVILLGRGCEQIKTNIHNSVLKRVVELSNLQGIRTENLNHISNSESRAYIIYTSGTTGTPKGVVVKNKNLVNLSMWQIQEGNLDINTTVLQQFAFIFDGSVWEIFSAGIAGAKLRMLNEIEKNNPETILKLLPNSQITLVPSMFRVILSYAENWGLTQYLNSRGVIFLAAEAVTKDIVSKYYEIVNTSERKLYNAYGPTECTVCATTHLISKDDDEIYIGEPIGNMKAYIMDGDKLCRTGEKGELCIAGRGVASGYLNKDELTKKRFVKNPINEDEIIYRTGDLAKWGKNGKIIYLGRIDQQVKIRGFRIEIEEIENCIRNIKNIVDAVVTVYEKENSKILCAYFVSSTDIKLENIKRELEKTLPNYMIPNYMQRMEKLPVTLNGKVDKKALPEPVITSSNYVEPVGEKEKCVVKVFEEILGIKKVGTSDDFFALSGDSIKAIRMVSKVRELGYSLDVATIMKEKSVKNIAVKMSRLQAIEYEQGEIVGKVELTPIQKQFFDSNLAEPHHFNQSFMLESMEPLNVELLKETLFKVVEHHDMLRSVYPNNEQIILSSENSDKCEIEYVNLTQVENNSELQDTMNTIGDRVQASFDLVKGPLVKAVLFHTIQKDYCLLCIHHLVVDGVSWRILVEDINHVYRQLQEGKNVVLPAKTMSFKEWSDALREYTKDYTLQKEVKYWNKIESLVAKSRISLEKEECPKGVIHTFAYLDKENTNTLLHKIGKAYNTEINDVLLVALFRALSKITGNSIVSVNLEGHGREPINKPVSIDRTVGWFTSVYPVVVDEIGYDLEKDIRYVKEILRKVPNHGLGYGVLKAYTKEIQGIESEVTFNYLGDFAKENDKFDIKVSGVEHGLEISRKNRFGSIIAIDSAIVDEELQLTTAYDSMYCNESFIRQLENEFLEQMKDIIGHCMQISETRYTASDFGEKEWTDNEFLAVYRKWNQSISNIYKLTPMQEGMLFHKLSNEKSTAYIIQNSFSMGKNINLSMLKQSLGLVVYKYAALRMRIVYKEVSEPRQIILEDAKPEIILKDISNENNEEKALQNIKLSDIERGFDLEEDSLIRFTIVKLSNDETKLILCFHHIMMDGWCLQILLKELSEFYTKLISGSSSEFIKDSMVRSTAYNEFMVSDKGLRDENIEYWKTLLSHYDTDARIIQSGRTQTTNTKVSVLKETIGDSIYTKLEQISKCYGITINTILETAWGILLQKYTNSNDVVFGKVVSGRNIEIDGIEKEIGLFINTVPVRVKLDRNKKQTVRQLLQVMQEQALETEKYDNNSLATIQKNVSSENALINTLFAFGNYSIVNNIGEKNLFILEDEREQTNYSLTLSVVPKEKLNIELMYDPELFDSKFAFYILRHYMNLISDLVFEENKDTNYLNMLDRSETEMINSFNNNLSSIIENKNVFEIFEEQVRINPNKIALENSDSVYTYWEVNERANQIAHKLLSLGVKVGNIVGVMAEKNLETIIGFLAILKVGAAYLPIDTKYPEERIKYMMLDSECEILLCTKKVEFDSSNMPVQIVDIKNNFFFNYYSKDNLNLSIKNSSLAYVMYTSGTTGNPKGVMIEHKSIIRLVKDTNYVDLENVKILQTGSLAFDAATFEIWGALLTGGTMFLADENILTDLDLLKRTIFSKKITTMFLTTALFNQIVSIDPSVFDGIVELLSGGEAISEEHVKEFLRCNQKTQFIHVYGPTENTTFSTFYKVPKGSLDFTVKIPIGKPITNTNAYILNGKLEKCGIGVPGEIYLSGAGIARGYLKREKLNVEKFIINSSNSEKLYKTGDLAYYGYDGNIYFLGRIDQQVKIRGFRIELGEIESKLKEIDYVKNVAVTIYEKNNEKYICAYIISDELINEDKIRKFLGNSLPDYMIPTYFIQVDEFKYSHNGKLLKKELPQPVQKKTYEYAKPETKQEKMLFKIFKDILNCENISIDDSFFNLGGDSIKAIRIISRLRTMGYEVSMASIMKCKTIRRLALEVKVTNQHSIKQEPVIGRVKNTPIVKQFFDYSLPKPNYFNQSFVISSNIRIDKVKFEKSLTSLVQHHDMLRAIVEKNQLTIRKANSNKIFDLCEFDIDRKEDKLQFMTEIANELQSSLDLSTGPLFRNCIFHDEKKDYVFMCIHHLIVDSVSWRIIVEDLNQLYAALVNETSCCLALKTTSFQECSKFIETYSDSEELRLELPYWENVQNGVNKSMLTKSSNSNNEEFLLGESKIDFEKSFTNELLYHAGKAYNTSTNDLLITALFRSISEVNRQKVISINLEGHGRENLCENIKIDRTVGWFTSIYPIVMDNVDKSIRDDIINTKEMLRRVPQKGIGYGILRMKNQSLQNGEPDITFNYLGEFVQEDKESIFKLEEIELGRDMAKENWFGSPISINGGIVREKLSFTISYNANLYNDNYIERLKDIFRKELMTLVKHCLEKEECEYTLSDFGELSWNNTDFINIRQKYNEKGNTIEQIYPLTSLQEGMLFHKIMEENSTEYVIQSEYKISQKIDYEIFRESVKLLSRKHEVLRTNIVYKDVEEPRQIILKGKVLETEVLNLTEEKSEIYKKVKNDDVKRGFDLENDSLIRFKIIKLTKDDYRLLICFHHIIMDGWCLSIILNDLAEIYTTISKNEFSAINLEEDKTARYEEFVKYILGKENSTGLNYWKKLLEGYEVQAGIKPDIIDKNHESDENTAEIKLNIKEKVKLENICNKYGITLNTIIETAWGIVLQKYNNVQDVVFGKVVSGRNAPINNIENIVGLFINTIPIRVSSKEGKTFIDLLKEMQEQALESTQYDHCSLAEIQNENILGSELVQTLLAFENYYVRDKNDCEMNFELLDAREETSFALTLNVYVENEIRLSLMYDTKNYKKETAVLVLKRLHSTLKALIENPYVLIDNIELVEKDEKDLILNCFNDTYVEYNLEQRLIDFFERQAAETPNKIAVRFKELYLTYSELNSRANYLAEILRNKNIKPGSIVGISAERSLEMIIGIYGILKADGAYLPIDPEHPAERINYMLDDSNISVLLVGPGGEKVLDKVNDKNISVINLENITGYKTENLPHFSSFQDIAYVIYTSGTTGQPKGVMVENKNIINRLLWMKDHYKMKKSDVILQKTTYTFDVSVWELFLWTFAGAELALLNPGGEKDASSIINAIFKYKVTYIHFVPSMFSVFLDAVKGCDKKDLKSLIRVFTSGEELTVKMVNDFLQLRNNDFTATLHNLYGPTETAVDSTYFDIENTEKVVEVPIGKPIANTKIYIINKSFCGIGIPGELCISGSGVSRGYLNKKELSLSKFVEDPYNDQERMYKTGDLACWLPDGNIKYLGRMDSQVKIRGFRIELGEIENRILMINGIKGAKILVNEELGDKILCCYYIAECTFTINKLKEILSKYLPDYMIPTYFVKVENFPVTKSGKLDRKALPKPEFDLDSNYVAPRNSIENELVNIYKEILGVQQIGINDSFFDLGGHSLRATKLANQIESHQKCRIPLREIMALKTVKKIAEYIEDNKKNNKVEQEMQHTLSSINEMSSAQKRLYALDQIQGANTTYNVPMLLEVNGELNIEKLKEAMQQVCNKHEILRTYFTSQDGKFLQITEPKLKVDIKIEKLNKSNIYDVLEEHITPFDLSKLPLFRILVINVSEGKNYVIFDIHHIIFDGESIPIFLQDLSKFYNGDNVEECNFQYKDYSNWQNQKNLDLQKEYWLKKFSDDFNILNLYPDLPHKNYRSYEGETYPHLISDSISQKVKTLAMNTGSTEYMILLSAFLILLKKYSRQKDLIIGSPIAGRVHPETQKMLGMFVNTVAIRVNVGDDLNYLQFLENVKEECFDIYENQEYPFEQLVEDLKLERDNIHNPLFDVMFAYQNSESAKIVLNNTEIKVLPIHSKVSKFDLTLIVEENNDGYRLDWEFCKDIFYKDTIIRMSNCFEQILENILDNPQTPVQNLECVDAAEKHRVMYDFNSSIEKYNYNYTAKEIFENVAQHYPENIAVEYENRQITYSQLNGYANYIADQLIGLNVHPEDIVPVFTKRSLDMIVAIYGIIKSGAAYLPMDINHPKNRIEHMIKESNAKIVITDEFGKSVLSKMSLNNVQILDLSGNYKIEEYNPKVDVTANNLAYVIYTSGTTGTPKGVMIENCNLINLIKWQSKTGEVDEKSVILQKSTYIFDASVWEIFLAGLTGAKLVLLSETENDDPEQLLNIIYKDKVTHTLIVPSMFRVILEYAKMHHLGDRLSNIKQIYLGAEKVTRDIIDDYLKLTGNPIETLTNLYGPTETTVCATYYHFDNQNTLEMIPIGKPVGNAEIYIMQDGNLCGIGMPGEICIGGAGVGRGYLNNQKLTDEKFKVNPFNSTKKIYYTGDLGRWCSDGSVEYLGRKDDQIKIRGFRIELSEIESKLNGIQEIRESAVALKTVNGERYICAYIVENKETEIDLIKEYLSESLPDYMIPTYFSKLKKLPLTNSGKVDRKALPNPVIKSNTNYEKAHNAEEQSVIDAFKEVLGVKQIGRRDNFFWLGGDSIKAIRIVSKLRQKGYSISVKIIMEEKVVFRISKHLKLSKESQYNQECICGNVELTPIQNTFFNSGITEPNHFNQSILLESDETIDELLLKESFNSIIKHHDMLRAIYADKKQVIRKYDDTKDMFLLQKINLINIDNNLLYKNMKLHMEQCQRSLNINNGPLIKTILFITEKHSYVFICIHHLVVDGVSWRILIEDINNSYTLLKEGKEIMLPSKTASYLMWSEKLKEYKKQILLKGENMYWENIKEKVQRCKLKRNGTGESEKKHIKIKFGQNETQSLLRDCGNAYKTEINDLLLTALARSIGKITHQPEVAFNLEGHGRENIDDTINTDRTVGWFTSFYPVYIEGVSKTLCEDIRNVKETLRKIPNHGIGYGVLTDGKLDTKELPDITFNYLGVFEEETSNSLLTINNNIERGNDISDSNKFGAAIEFTGIIVSEKLEFNVSYYSSDFTDEFMENFTSEYQIQLKEIIEHCKNKRNIEFTASDYGELEWSDREFQEVYNRIAEKGNQIQKIYPLTPLQEGMIFIKEIDPSSKAYTVQNVFNIHQRIDIDAMQSAVELLMAKHEALRTCIIYKNISVPRQIVLDERDFAFSFINISKGTDFENKLERVQRADLQKGFDLENDSLFRVTLVKIKNNEWKLIMSFHHIIIDGWCLSIILNDLVKFYSELLEDKDYDMILDEIEPNNTYEKYVRLMREKEKVTGLEYWKKLIGDCDEAANIKSWNAPDFASIHSAETILSQDLYKKLEKLAGEIGVTANTFIEAAWGITLQLYCNLEDVVFGKVVSGRNIDLDNIENTIGLFINTIPIRVTTESNDTVRALLERLQKQALESSQYDDCALPEILKQSTLGNELIQTLLVFENYYIRNKEEEGPITLEFESAAEETNYDLTLMAYQTHTLNLRLMFKSDKYNSNDIKSILHTVEFILEKMVNYPDEPIDKIDFCNEKEKILEEFNNTKTDYPVDMSITELFQKQVQDCPEKIGIMDKTSSYSYKQIDEYTNKVAEKLLSLGVKKGDFVAVFAEKRVETVISMLAILKAGGAYLPIDNKYPEKRIKYILKDSDCNIMLVNSTQNIADLNLDVVLVNVCEEMQKNTVSFKSSVERNSNDLAYLIYTSGTTGEPKGVMVKDQNVVRLVKNTNYVDFNDICILQTGSLAFDASTFEIWGALLNGGKVYLASDEVMTNTSLLRRAIEEKDITTMFITTALFNQLINLDVTVFDELDTLLFGGEATSEKHVRELLTHNKKINLVNVYGPTESTTFATYYPFNREGIREKTPIGKPISNTKVLVMKKHTMCGIGIPGELCIAGDGVAEGYLGKKDLTQEKFKRITYLGNGNVYYTGDLVRWLDDGNIEFLGRLDNQIKLRGFRIELSEIASHLTNISRINEAVAVLLGDEDKYICAYVVCDSAVDTTEIRRQLTDILPDYMIPRYIMQISKLPVTRNGKIDVKELPKPYINFVESKNDLAVDGIEAQVINLIKDVLSISTLNMDDNFFDIGGHSLKAIQLVNLIEMHLGVRVSLSDLVSGKTIKEICKMVEMGYTGKTYEELEIVEAEEIE